MASGLADGARFIGRALPERGLGQREAVFARHLVFFMSRLERSLAGEPRLSAACDRDDLVVSLDGSPFVRLRPSPGRVEAVVRREGAKRPEALVLARIESARRRGLFATRRARGGEVSWRLGIAELEALPGVLTEAARDGASPLRRSLSFAARREAYAAFLRSGRICARGGHRMDLTRTRPRFRTEGDELQVVCDDCARGAHRVAA